jgi:hypothetical protein
MIGPTDLLRPSPTPHFKTFQVFLIYCLKRPKISDIKQNIMHFEKSKIPHYKKREIWLPLSACVKPPAALTSLY